MVMGYIDGLSLSTAWATYNDAEKLAVVSQVAMSLSRWARPNPGVLVVLPGA